MDQSGLILILQKGTTNMREKIKTASAFNLMKRKEAERKEERMEDERRCGREHESAQMCAWYTYRAIQLPLVIHPKVETAVHPFNAYQAHRQAYEFQNTWGRMTQLFYEVPLDDGDERLSLRGSNRLTQVFFLR